MIEIVNGDLLNAKADYICHQVNCQGVMGSGVARAIRGRWPLVYEKYKAVCRDYGDRRADLLGQVLGVRVDDDTAVINIFGQYGYGKDGACYTNLNALRRGCEEIAANARPGSSIAMPYRIGCGLGGGDWEKVMDMLAEVFRKHHLTLYKI